MDADAAARAWIDAWDRAWHTKNARVAEQHDYWAETPGRTPPWEAWAD